MKEFEKLWKENDGCGKEGCEWYWRAALKWTLKMSKQIDEEDAPIFMNDVIEGELDAGQKDIS